MKPLHIVVVISANTEWKATVDLFPDAQVVESPLGQWFCAEYEVNEKKIPTVFFHGGWGKISAAASAQYVIDRWKPDLLINLGTCGGIAGEVEKGTIILVNQTIVYDILEQMLDPDEAIKYYATEIDLSWLREPYPDTVLRTLLVSGDRDLVAEEVPHLKSKYGAVAGDWESGAIAWVASRNGTRCLILRGVTDTVDNENEEGEAYAVNAQLFIDNTPKIMERLLRMLPSWISINQSILQ